jgi:hypothetical protein
MKLVSRSKEVRYTIEISLIEASILENALFYRQTRVDEKNLLQSEEVNAIAIGLKVGLQTLLKDDG